MVADASGHVWINTDAGFVEFDYRKDAPSTLEIPYGVPRPMTITVDWTASHWGISDPSSWPAMPDRSLMTLSITVNGQTVTSSSSSSLISMTAYMDQSRTISFSATCACGSNSRIGGKSLMVYVPKPPAPYSGLQPTVPRHVSTNPLPSGAYEMYCSQNQPAWPHQQTELLWAWFTPAGAMCDGRPCITYACCSLPASQWELVVNSASYRVCRSTYWLENYSLGGDPFQLTEAVAEPMCGLPDPSVCNGGACYLRPPSDQLRLYQAQAECSCPFGMTGDRCQYQCTIGWIGTKCTDREVPCPAGQACASLGGSILDVATSNATMANAVACPLGYYCELGSLQPTICTKGTDCSSSGLAQSRACPDGFTCEDPSLPPV